MFYSCSLIEVNIVLVSFPMKLLQVSATVASKKAWPTTKYILDSIAFLPESASSYGLTKLDLLGFDYHTQGKCFDGHVFTFRLNPRLTFMFNQKRRKTVRQFGMDHCDQFHPVNLLMKVKLKRTLQSRRGSRSFIK